MEMISKQGQSDNVAAPLCHTLNTADTINFPGRGLRAYSTGDRLPSPASFARNSRMIRLRSKDAALSCIATGAILPFEHPVAMAYIASSQPGYQLVYVSPQIANLGFPPEAWLTETDLRLRQIHKDDFDRVNQAALHSRRTGEKFDCYYRLYDGNGKMRWLHDEASVVCDESGTPLFTSGVMLDITEKKELEAELHEHRYCLERPVTQTSPTVCAEAVDDASNWAHRMIALTRDNWIAHGCYKPKIKKTSPARSLPPSSEEQLDSPGDWARKMIGWRVTAAGAIA